MNPDIKPPYYAVIFTSRKKVDSREYDEMLMRLDELSLENPGFLGIQFARGEDGLGVSVSYWKTLEDLANWKSNLEHRAAQSKAKSEWYAGYEVRICKVERQYDFGSLSATGEANDKL